MGKRVNTSSKIIRWTAACAAVVALGYVALARSGAFQLTREELIARYADAESKFVTVHGIDVHYKDEGTGPAILLLHGSFGSLASWDGVVARLKDRYRLIRFDKAPTGLTGDLPASAEGLSLEGFMAEFLDAVGVDRVALAGVSSGGIMAYRFASAYPGRTTALVLANAPSAVVDNAAVKTPVALNVVSFLSSTVLNHSPALYWRIFLESLYADPTRVTDAKVRRYTDINRRENKSPRIPSLFSRVNDTAEIDGVLAKVRTPTLLLWGVHDRVLPEAMGLQLQKKLTGVQAELIWLKGTGHYPPDESPDIFADHLARFLGQIRDAESSGQQ